ncbi:MAG: DUF167 domain-containing protein [Dehalococcoidia bacterium]
MTRRASQAGAKAKTEARLDIRVQPGARRNEIIGLAEAVLRIRIAAPAHEDRANRALVEFLAGKLGVPKGRVRIVRGHTSRNKVISVEGLEREEAIRRLLEA